MLYRILCLSAVIALAFVFDKTANAVQLESRILGGHNENINIVPYQVSISQNNLPLCSGSIIAPKWILTAAHCLAVLDNSPVDANLSVRAGSANQFSGGVLIPVTRYFIHRLFDPATYDNDIALVKLSQALVYSESIQPVTLPERGWVVPVGQVARISGWGKSETQAQAIFLKTTEVFPVSKESCQRSYGNHITNNMFCAGFIGGGRDFCVGDGGGPLMVANVQYGIISHSNEECGSDAYPGIYTNVVRFLDYITDITLGRS